jgi:hypothetical protein
VDAESASLYVRLMLSVDGGYFTQKAAKLSGKRRKQFNIMPICGGRRTAYVVALDVLKKTQIQAGTRTKTSCKFTQRQGTPQICEERQMALAKHTAFARFDVWYWDKLKKLDQTEVKVKDETLVLTVMQAREYDVSYFYFSCRLPMHVCFNLFVEAVNVLLRDSGIKTKNVPWQ